MSVEEPPRAAAKRFEGLDALRGVCALMVVLYHFPAPGLTSSSLLIRHSDLFVDYFFVLSGFVIAFSYGDRLAARSISVGRFMMLRTGRIYPLHLAVIGAYVALDLINLAAPGAFGSVTTSHPFSGSRSIPALISNLLLLQSFGVHSGLTWNGPSWSIAAEMWCYLLFASLVAVRGRVDTILIGALSAGAFAWLMIAHGSINGTFELGFVRCVYGFGIGFLTYQLFRRSGPWGGTIVEIVALLVVIGFVTVAGGVWTMMAPFIFALGVYAFASGGGLLSRLLATGPFQLLGLISYSIYMIHSFLQARILQVLHIILPNYAVDGKAGILLVGPPLVGDLLAIMMLALVVGCSFASYSLVEKPGREFTRRWLRHRDEGRAAADPPAASKSLSG